VSIRLTPECVESIKACLGKRFRADRFDQFVVDIQADIASFSDETFREAHDQLSRLWVASVDEDLSPARVRARINRLSRRATEYVDGRFSIVMERLSLNQDAVDFKIWARTANADELIRVSRVLAAEGARAVPGRSRGKGKREASHPSPQIMGVTRGDPASGALRGGRPTNGARIDLVMQLGMSWYHATEEMPNGRASRSGFRDLVFLVFGWLFMLDDSRDHSGVYALRQYFSLLEEASRRRRASDPG
jgi:hypothetical protein